MRGRVTDLAGQRFGRLTVVRRVENSPAGAARWAVRCDCGTEKNVRSSQLTEGSTVSCGCYLREVAGARVRTHGLTNSFEFRSWRAMKTRCTSEKHPRYHRYGGRGITFCERWAQFENFYADMGPCPFDDGSIERVNNDEGYTPQNCVWLPKSQQSKNRNFADMKRG